MLSQKYYRYPNEKKNYKYFKLCVIYLRYVRNKLILNKSVHKFWNC